MFRPLADANVLSVAVGSSSPPPPPPPLPLRPLDPCAPMRQKTRKHVERKLKDNEDNLKDMVKQLQSLGFTLSDRAS